MESRATQADGQPGQTKCGPVVAVEVQVPIDLIRAWTRRAGDPDTDLADWVEKGTPLGVNLEIKPRGIIPPADKEGEPEWTPVARLPEGPSPTTPVIADNLDDTKEEIRRLLDFGYVMKVSRDQVDEHFSQGTVSKLVIIVKLRPDGTRKRRLIIDLRRSGGNSKAKLDDKIVLPRAMDAVAMIRALHKLHPDSPTARWRSRGRGGQESSP